MEKLTVLALRLVLAVVLGASLVVQLLVVPAIWGDLEGEAVQVPVTGLAFLAVIVVQIVAVALWRLASAAPLTRAALPWLDAVVAASGLGAVVALAFAVLLAPGDAAPGIVLLVCVAGAVVAGFGLAVLLLRLRVAGALSREPARRL